MINQKCYQTGMGMPLMVYLIATFGFFLLLGFKLVPPFYENWYVEKALMRLAENHSGGLQNLSKSAAEKELSNYYTINNVRNQEITKALEIDRMREKTLFKINYETRVPVILNIDAVLKFDNVLDSSKPDDCCDPPDGGNKKPNK